MWKQNLHIMACFWQEMISPQKQLLLIAGLSLSAVISLKSKIKEPEFGIQKIELAVWFYQNIIFVKNSLAMQLSVPCF